MSLSEADLAVLDAYVEGAGLPSRSGGVQRAIRMLRFPTLEDEQHRQGLPVSGATFADVQRLRPTVVQRFSHRVGRVSADELAAIDEALRLHLDL